MEITVSGEDLLTGFFIVCGASDYRETLVNVYALFFFDVRVPWYIDVI